MDPLPVTLGIINFNGKALLTETLRCARASQPPPAAILLVDNGSTDGSVEEITTSFPEVTLIRSPVNLGAAKARNIILEAAQTEWVMLLDHDISLKPDTLKQLIHFMQSNPETGACHPEIEDPADPEVFHYNGGGIHYLGALAAREKPSGTPRHKPERFVTVSGAALMVRKATALQIGGMDPDYFFNWEDGDFTCRLTLAGFPCFNIPYAAVLHRSKSRGVSKVFYQVRNRWFFMLKLYDTRTLLLIAPMLLLFEPLQMVLLHIKGGGRAYWKANVAVWKALPHVRRKRRSFLPMKQLADREWLTATSMYVPPALAGKSFTRSLFRLLNAFFSFYWKCICHLLSR